MFKVFKKYTVSHRQKGMTIVELLVAMVIFSIITGVVLFNYGDFNSSLTIQNLADDIALTIRRAQSYAIGVRGSSGSFDIGYGVHFRVTEYNLENPNMLYSGSNKSFILFKRDSEQDTPKYEGVGDSCEDGSDCLEMLYIRSTDEIESVSYTLSGGDDTMLEENETLDIYFKRPNPEPRFCVASEESDICEIDATLIEEVKIVISSLKEPNNKKVIKVFNSGQISVSSYEEQTN